MTHVEVIVLRGCSVFVNIFQNNNLLFKLQTTMQVCVLNTCFFFLNKAYNDILYVIARHTFQK